MITAMPNLAEIKLAQLYFDHNETDKLLTLLKDLKLQFDSVKNEDAEADWNKADERHITSATKIFLNHPVTYLQTYNILKDSSAKKLNILKESDVNQQLANFEKQYQIDNLKNNNRIQRVNIFTQRLFV